MKLCLFLDRSHYDWYRQENRPRRPEEGRSFFEPERRTVKIYRHLLPSLHACYFLIHRAQSLIFSRGCLIIIVPFNLNKPVSYPESLRCIALLRKKYQRYEWKITIDILLILEAWEFSDNTLSNFRLIKVSTFCMFRQSQLTRIYLRDLSGILAAFVCFYL